MPRRTIPPLTDAERMRRYRANHPEKREEHRLAMQKLRAARRQQEDLKRLALVAPDQNDKDPIAERMKAVTKISTGLTQQEPLADAGETLCEGSKV